MDDLPWQTMFGKRCKARKAPTRGGFYGRCELAPHWGIDHALERGLILVRWSDGDVRYEHTPMAQMLMTERMSRDDIVHILTLDSKIRICEIEGKINDFVFREEDSMPNSYPCLACSKKIREENSI